MPRAVDREHTMPLRQERHERQPLVCAVSTPVDKDDRRAASELENLRLASRPPHSLHVRPGGKACDQLGLCGFQRPVASSTPDPGILSEPCSTETGAAGCPTVRNDPEPMFDVVVDERVASSA